MTSPRAERRRMVKAKMVEETRTLRFNMAASFVQNIAREKMLYENNIASAAKILTGMFTPEDDEQALQIQGLAWRILNGNVVMSGDMVSGFNFDDPEDLKDRNDVSEWNEKLLKQLSDAKSELETLTQKFCFVVENLSESSPYTLRSIEREYRREYGERLFEDGEFYVPESDSFGSKLLDDFMDHIAIEEDDDYGWLEPDGTYHPVEWCNHQDWATDYLKDKGKGWDGYRDLIGEYDTPGDVLVFKFGWVLLHNPGQGNAFPTFDSAKGMTKHQKEFLFDYYRKRGRIREADALYADEE